jgi:hypothetical protein
VSGDFGAGGVLPASGRVAEGAAPSASGGFAAGDALPVPGPFEAACLAESAGFAGPFGLKEWFHGGNPVGSAGFVAGGLPVLVRPGVLLGLVESVDVVGELGFAESPGLPSPGDVVPGGFTGFGGITASNLTLELAAGGGGGVPSIGPTESPPGVEPLPGATGDEIRAAGADATGRARLSAPFDSLAVSNGAGG